MQKKTIVLILAFLLIIMACNTKKIVTKECKENKECSSGICNHQKAGFGICALETCKTGEKTDNNNYFCNSEEKLEKSKNVGEQCKQDYECYKQTCFMIPDCQMTDIPITNVYCKENKCTSEIMQDKCEAKGMKRVLAKSAFMKDSAGNCFESVAQTQLPTICVQCGNGICEQELESECNCPQDCK